MNNEQREKLKESIEDILCTHNQDLYAAGEIAEKILQEVEKVQ